MHTARTSLGIVAVFVVLAWQSAGVLADEDDAALKRRLTELNHVTGEDPIKGEVKALASDPAGTKKLLALATKTAKEDPLAFNYNGAFILASAAHELKDLEAGKVFYRICINYAVKLVSAQKLRDSYQGLISMLTQHKKFDELVKVSQEFLEIPDDGSAMIPVRRLKYIVLQRMVLAMARQGEADKALKMVDRLIEGQPEAWFLYELKGGVLQEASRFEEAIKSYETAMEQLKKDDRLSKEDKAEQTQQDLIAIGAIIINMARKGSAEQALKKVDRFLETQPSFWFLHTVKGGVLREESRYEEAIKSYEAALRSLKKDEQLPAELKTQESQRCRLAMSDVYVDLGQINKAAEILKGLLDEDPDDPTYNNNLGYIWADHDMNLEESEKLIRKALEEDRKQRKGEGVQADEDKDSAAYLDSLGWVLYKQKKHKDAKKYLLQAAADKDGQHIEILDHLGDVHLALGEKAEAIAVWKKAVEVAGKNKREQQKKIEVEKKLKANE